MNIFPEVVAIFSENLALATLHAFTKKFMKKKGKHIWTQSYDESFVMKLPFKWYVNDQNRLENDGGDLNWNWETKIVRYHFQQFFSP